MHITTKEVDDQGVHILTSIVEADGPLALCSADATLDAKVISVQRTDAGGVKVQTSLTITEPAPAVAPTPEPVVPEPTPEERASAYLEGKGLSADDAKAAVAKFGAGAVLAKQRQ